MAERRQNTRALMALLADAGVPFVVIGGVAAYLHGTSRPTEDLDVAIEFNEENMLRLTRALAAHAPKHAGIPGARPIQESPALLASYRNLYVECDLGRLDLLGEVPPIGGYRELATAAVRTTVDGKEIMLISLDQLIAIKTSLGRLKDRLMLQELLVIKSRGAGGGGEPRGTL